MKRPLIAVVVLALSLFASLANAAPLPQRHPYERTLREYFATLKEEDFVIDLKPLVYDEEFFKNPANVQRYWLMHITAQTDIPSIAGALSPAKHFTLAAMEAGDAVNIGGGAKGELINPAHVAWWVQWDYPGNPYRNSKPLKLRAFVNAAADMMMQDEEHESGRSARSDFLGGSIIRWAYAYLICRDVAPEAAQKAFADGLIRQFQKLESWTPQGGGGSDMEFFQLVGMYYAGQALGGDFPARALKRAHVVIDTITSKTGYEMHGKAFDISYQGIALRFLTWAATLYKDPKIDLALHKMLVLKSYNSLPEPDGQLFGPTIFNTGTAADAPHDQWAWESRDYAMAMIDDLALYNIWSRTGVPSEQQMRDLVKAGFDRIGAGKTPVVSEAEPGAWKENHWGMTLNFAYDQYKQGSFERWRQLEAAKAPLTKPVWSRGENFINDLNGGGEFLAAKFDDYGVVIHTGAIANHWASGVSGKSGGGVVAFWTPHAGNVFLGRCRATQSATPDEWDDKNNRGPYTWAVHALTGKGGKGNYFSTARLKNIQSKYVIDGTKSATVTVGGDLAGEYLADTFDELKGKAVYAREFKVDNLGVGVTTTLSTDGSDKITELYETFPVFLSPKEADPKIELRVNNNWVAATDALTVADQVRVIRYGVASYIVFEKPRAVKLGPENKPEERWHTIGRNVLVDVSDLLPNVEFKYRLMAQ